ncbi:TRAP transporter large permease [Terrarubrum flagellatum]|uniref:TRAP transporter large permease n=1 Tax=Terrirubrum flagellatum TaxID=2895980 RepID=UPI00314532D0
MIVATLLLFAVLLATGMPIAFVILGSSLLYFAVNPIAPSVLAQRLTGSLESFPLLAIPFFVVAGAAMARGGIAERLYGFADGLVGHWRGGLAQVAVINSLLIGTMSGSSNADAAIDARTIVPVMRRQGYTNGFASAISASSGLIAPIMPPSIGLIVYGLLTSTSVSRLFIGGVIPAFLIAIGLMIMVRIIASRRGYGATRNKRLPASEIVERGRRAIWALAMPVLLLFGLRIGWFTPTELGVIAAVYAFIVGLVIYRGMKPRDVYEILRESAFTTANVMVILAASAAFSVVLTLEEVPQFVVSNLLSVSNNPYLILVIINIALLVLGMIMESLSLMVILAPLLNDIIQKVGIDPVHFGVVLVFNLGIGSVHPPVGTVVYTVCSITKCSVEEFTWELLPFLGALLAVLAVLIFFPPLTLFLPNLLF